MTGFGKHKGGLAGCGKWHGTPKTQPRMAVPHGLSTTCEPRSTGIRAWRPRICVRRGLKVTDRILRKCTLRNTFLAAVLNPRPDDQLTGRDGCDTRTGTSATITNNTVIGLGPVNFIAQNGIQVSRVTTGTVSRAIQYPGTTTRGARTMTRLRRGVCLIWLRAWPNGGSIPCQERSQAAESACRRQGQSGLPRSPTSRSWSCRYGGNGQDHLRSGRDVFSGTGGGSPVRRAGLFVSARAIARWIFATPGIDTSEFPHFGQSADRACRTTFGRPLSV